MLLSPLFPRVIPNLRPGNNVTLSVFLDFCEHVVESRWELGIAVPRRRLRRPCSRRATTPTGVVVRLDAVVHSSNRWSVLKTRWLITRCFSDVIWTIEDGVIVQRCWYCRRTATAGVDLCCCAAWPKACVDYLDDDFVSLLLFYCVFAKFLLFHLPLPTMSRSSYSCQQAESKAATPEKIVRSVCTGTIGATYERREWMRKKIREWTMLYINSLFVRNSGKLKTPRSSLSFSHFSLLHWSSRTTGDK